MADLGPLTYTLEVGKSKINSTVELALIQPAGLSLSIYVATLVESHRKLEIVEAWRWLFNGLRDRYLVPNLAFGPGNIFTAAPIDSLTEFSRVTSLDGGTIVTPGTIGLGIHQSARDDTVILGRGAGDATNIMENTVKRLIEFAREDVNFRI
jgi:hypothetical protein